MLHAVRPKKRTPNTLMESAFQWPNRVQAAKRFPNHSTLELTTTQDYDSDGNLTGTMVYDCGPSCNVASPSELASGFLEFRHPITPTNAKGDCRMMGYTAVTFRHFGNRKLHKSRGRSPRNSQ